MCALFGFLDCGRRIPLKALQKLIQALANASEVRGDHASGISYMKDNQLTIYKRPKPAHKMKFRLPNHTRAVMGHVRYTTQGSQEFNQNNHPFRGHADIEFAFAHNGVLHNDMQLRRDKQLPVTNIETDSYVAVQLIEMQKELNFDTLKSMAEDVRGSFTFTILDETNALWFVKGSSPLYLIYFPELKLYVYSSTASIMKTALKHTPLRWMHYEVIEADEGDILRIDHNGKITRDRFRVPSVFNSRFGGSRFRYSVSDIAGWDYEYDDATAEELNKLSETDYADLLDLCGYFGVSEMEILRLRHMGYTYDEIEEYLFSADNFDDFYSEDCFCGEL